MNEILLTMGAGIFGITVTGLIGGALLELASKWFTTDENPLIDSIDELLPQTQCGQCGHPGCRPYAQAIADGEKINRCPPGGQETVDRLAQLLGLESLELDADPATVEADNVALIIEEDCIGCTKCIQACPVDAIIGAAKLMHTVINDACTGCDLCIEPCPVDCIVMIDRPKPDDHWIPKIPESVMTDRRGQVRILNG